MMRLMSAFPELLTLLKAMFAAIKAVASALTLLIVFLYLFGIVHPQYLLKYSIFDDMYDFVF